MKKYTEKKKKNKTAKTVLTVKILEAGNRPLEDYFLINLIEGLGNYRVINLYRKSQEEEKRGCACQRSW